MDSNTHSGSRLDRLGALAAVVDELVAEDLDGLADAALAEQVFQVRRQLDRLEGRWLRALAAVDGRGAAGAEQGLQAGSTAGWLRARLRMGAGAASSFVRTARALYRGPLTATAQALAEGTIAPAHAQVLAAGTHDLPHHLAAEAEPVLVEAARRLDPPRLRRAVAHLRLVADPNHTDHHAERRQQQRGLWLAATWEGMVAVNGLLDPEAGQTLLAALEPLARPTNADDARSAGQRRADALAELARRTLEAGQLPQTGGVRPQLTVTVDWTASSPRMGWAARPAGPMRWSRRRAGGWPATGRSPGCWSPATPPPTTTRVAMAGWRTGCGGRRGCSPRPLVVPRPSRWRSAAPPGSSPPPNGPPWWSATVAARWRAATDPRPGARPIICATGCMAAPPTLRTWPWCAVPTTERCTKAGGGWSATLTAASPPAHRIEDPSAHRPPPEPAGRATQPPPLVGARPCRPADPPLAPEPDPATPTTAT
jgi:hypothetical protein